MDREVVVQSLGAIQPFVTPWKAAYQVSLSFTISQNFLKLLFIESVILSNLLILCCPPLLLSSIFPRIKVFSNESALHNQVAKVLELQLQLQSSSKNIQDWFLWGLTGWISLQPKGLSRVFSSTTVQKHQIFSTQPSLWSKSICIWLL